MTKIRDGWGSWQVAALAQASLLETGASGYTWAAATDGADSAASMELANFKAQTVGGMTVYNLITPTAGS
jgi:hypothetical protein